MIWPSFTKRRATKQRRDRFVIARRRCIREASQTRPQRRPKLDSVVSRSHCRAGLVAMSILLATSAFAANPFLDAKDDKPVSANFRGTEWNDESISGEIPLTARVVRSEERRVGKEGRSRWSP